MKPDKEKLIFYEKPGCVGNQAQKKFLRGNGVELIVHDLLIHAWSVEQLRPFFADTPVPQWFNSSAPAVKSGQIKIAELSASEALQLLIESPILIARPLLAYGDLKQSRFVPGPVLDALGICLAADEDLDSCPLHPDSNPSKALSSTSGACQ